ncbi:hypothetical protein PTT_07515 [Pyrenophora teres f. teres 0-1]|uniref:Uncharacterized protein n=1 Tax=Pyrenophora teres f. teres (strain 0-1) TaxID=861557 RepID=E3RHU1_PYRTT|nr:hypothetical protein PTT_07515 [Pyrenophora teres f. teres 0-1]
MPKVLSSRRNRLLNSTAERRARAVRVEQESLKIDFRYKRCKEKNLRCFVLNFFDLVLVVFEFDVRRQLGI